jgi:hypothetical protein
LRALATHAAGWLGTLKFADDLLERLALLAQAFAFIDL